MEELSFMTKPLQTKLSPLDPRPAATNLIDLFVVSRSVAVAVAVVAAVVAAC